MIMQFRTKRDINGNTKYLGIDTGAEVYSTQCRTWISKDIPELKTKDYREMIKQLEDNEWRKVEFIG